MIKKGIDQAVISTEDRDSLEKAWYEYQAARELMQQNTSESFLTILGKANMHYQKTWEKILNKYFTSKGYTGATYSWDCEFYSCLVTISEDLPSER